MSHTFTPTAPRRAAQEHAWDSTADQVARNEHGSTIWQDALAKNWDRDRMTLRYGAEVVACLDQCREAARRGGIKALVKHANALSVAMERRGLFR